MNAVESVRSCAVSYISATFSCKEVSLEAEELFSSMRVKKCAKNKIYS